MRIAAESPAGMPGAGGDLAARSDPRLKPAAHEFEACLMKEFLEPLQQDALFEEGSDAGGGCDAALLSFGAEGLARAISERGGFGIADKILEHFGQRRQGLESGRPVAAAEAKK